jgi:restriction system protein
MTVPVREISPDQFEQLVFDYIRDSASAPTTLRLERRDLLHRPDGEYEIDITARFEVLGVAFLVLVECKRYSGSVKRDIVQILHSKIVATGAQKGVLFSTGAFQKGAVKYARHHGIALILVEEHDVRAIVKAAAAPPQPATVRLDRFVLYEPVALLPDPPDEDIWQVSYQESLGFALQTSHCPEPEDRGT